MIIQGNSNQNNQNEINNNNSNSNQTFLIAKLVTTFSFLFIFFMGKYLIPLPTYNVSCIVDPLYYITSPIAQYFFENTTIRHFFVIVTSLGIDFMCLYMIISFVFYGKSWRFPLSIMSFYILRFIIQSMFRMPYNSLYSYDNPGFPSLFVSYYKYNDFFFSGHCGLPMIMAMEARKNKNKFMFIFAIVTMVLVAIVLIVTRSHYLIDIITGIIIAHYLYKIISQYLDCLDHSWIFQIESEESRQYEESLKQGYIPLKKEEERKSFANGRNHKR